MMLGIELAEITIRSLNRDLRYSNSASMYSIAYKLSSPYVLKKVTMSRIKMYCLLDLRLVS